MATAPPDARWLRLEVELPVSPSDAFVALTDAEVLRRWWGPHGFTLPHVEIDPRVGGRYRFAMRPPDGALFHLEGRFLTVEAPRRLRFTFRWEEPDRDDVDTVVTLSLVPLGRATRLIVDQGAFLTDARRELHEGGWSDSLQRLRALFPEA